MQKLKIFFKIERCGVRIVQKIDWSIKTCQLLGRLRDLQTIKLFIFCLLIALFAIYRIKSIKRILFACTVSKKEVHSRHWKFKRPASNTIRGLIRTTRLLRPAYLFRSKFLCWWFASRHFIADTICETRFALFNDVLRSNE